MAEKPMPLLCAVMTSRRSRSVPGLLLDLRSLGTSLSSLPSSLLSSLLFSFVESTPVPLLASDRPELPHSSLRKRLERRILLWQLCFDRPCYLCASATVSHQCISLSHSLLETLLWESGAPCSQGNMPVWEAGLGRSACSDPRLRTEASFTPRALSVVHTISTAPAEREHGHSAHSARLLCKLVL